MFFFYYNLVFLLILVWRLIVYFMEQFLRGVLSTKLTVQTHHHEEFVKLVFQALTLFLSTQIYAIGS